MTGLFRELPKATRPPKDLLDLDCGSTWLPPSELPSLRGVRRLGFDTETRDDDLDTLGPGVRRGAYVVGMSLALDEDGPRMYIPVRHEGGGNLDLRQVKRWAKSELENFDGELVGANILYDLEMMAAPDWDVHFRKVKKVHDVLVAEPIIDEWRQSYSLDVVSLIHLGIGKDYDHARVVMDRYGWRTEREYKKNLWRLSARNVGPYAEADADRPLRILPKQLELLRQDDQLHIYEEIERPLIPVLLAMRRRGVRVNMRRADEVRGLLAAERDRWLVKLKHFAGPKAELQSADSFAAALEERGLEFGRTPKTHAPKIDKFWLEANIADEMVQCIAAGRRVNTLINTFMDGHLQNHVVNGRIHCEFNQLKREDEGTGGIKGTIARFSSSNPNLQNLPSRESKADLLMDLESLGSLGDAIRSIFKPEDGEEWQRDDYSQIEFRFSVNYAIGKGSEEARDMYRCDPKTDFHNFCAEMIGVPPEDKRRRKGVKNLNFAKGYGAGAGKIAAMLGWDEAEAQRFIDEYDRKLPFMRALYQKCDRSAARHGYVTTVAGRKCRFPFWEPTYNPRPKRPGIKGLEQAQAEYGPKVKRADTYKAMNRKMQGSGAELMKRSLIAAWDAGICDVIGAFLLTVHDETDTSIPRTAAGDEAGRELTRIMETCVKIDIPIRVESQRGVNWGACA